MRIQAPGSNLSPPPSGESKVTTDRMYLVSISGLVAIRYAETMPPMLWPTRSTLRSGVEQGEPLNQLPEPSGTCRYTCASV